MQDRDSNHRRSRASLALAAWAWAFCILARSPVVAADLSEEQFKHWHASLRPKPNALWRSVPWKTNVLDGQRQAAEDDKPIFIWAMDGHPLGCT